MTKNKITVRDFEKNDLDALQAVFNSFVRDSYAAYPESELTPEQFNKLLAQAKIILTLQAGETIIGYGYISSYKPLPNFDHTGVLSYFILTDHTGLGFGSALLQELFNRGKEIGITNYLAHISSRNEQSLNFHKKHGFKEVGRLMGVAKKHGETIDVVWVQKQIGEK
ncbi:MAG: N-acetyltransferase family protein [Chrysiogenia bacterium]